MQQVNIIGQQLKFSIASDKYTAFKSQALDPLTHSFPEAKEVKPPSRFLPLDPNPGEVVCERNPLTINLHWKNFELKGGEMGSDPNN